MIEDDILREVRAARDAFARSHGYDLHAMVEDLRAQNERGDWPVVRLAPRRPAGYDPSRCGFEPSPPPAATTSGDDSVTSEVPLGPPDR